MHYYSCQTAYRPNSNRIIWLTKKAKLAASVSEAASSLILSVLLIKYR